jgi:hypothetical protein
LKKSATHATNAQETRLVVSVNLLPSEVWVPEIVVEFHFHKGVEQIPLGVDLSVKVEAAPCSTKYVSVIVEDGPVAVIVLLLSPIANEVSESAVGRSSGVLSEPLRTEEDHSRETWWKNSFGVHLNTPEETVTIWVFSEGDGGSRTSLSLVAEEVN